MFPAFTVKAKTCTAPGCNRADLTGAVIGRLTVVGVAPKRDTEKRWSCLCSCGSEVEVLTASLTSGKTLSCGCLRREATASNRMKHFDLSGRVFGEWSVLSEADRSGKKRRWHCRCSCGYESVVHQDGLLYGNSKSCNRPGHKARPSTTPGYSSWYSMKNRCLNETHVYYASYGGRGIKVCQRWKESFWNFHADMGPRPDGTSLDRIDPNGDYEPGNCRWATPSQQQSNQRRSRYVQVEVKRASVKELADALGLSYATVHSRLSKARLL